MIRLTERQIEALLACVSIVDAGEWPFDDVKREVAQRAASKLESLRPNEPVVLKSEGSLP